MALFFADAELYTLIRTSSEVLGIISILKDLGRGARGQVVGDASACLGTIRRQGRRKMRHLNTSYLWVQEKSANKELQFGKVPSLWNPADMMTKYITEQDIERHMKTINAEFHHGRTISAPKLVKTDPLGENVYGLGNLHAIHNHNVGRAGKTEKVAVFTDTSRQGVRLPKIRRASRQHAIAIGHL